MADFTRYPTLIFDLDGTQCECGIYYAAAKDAFVAYQHARHPDLAPALIGDVLEKLDLVCTSAPGAFTRARFPRSFRAASYALDVIAGACGAPVAPDLEGTEGKATAPYRGPDIAAGDASYRIGDAVFDAPYELFDGVVETLQHYRALGWQLLVYTKGDYQVQESKLQRHGLLDLFDGVFITHEKTPELLNWIVHVSRCAPQATWMIGDSLKDDIAPAVALGLGTVHVAGGHQWVYNDAQVKPLRTITALPELLSLVAGPDTPSARTGQVPKVTMPAVVPVLPDHLAPLPVGEDGPGEA
jgi:FMN phosphatase YigB (HAD superfamily)